MSEARIERGKSSAGTLPALELHWGPACVLYPGAALAGACEAGEWEAASRINAEVAGEFVLEERGAALLQEWCLLRIGEVWSEDLVASAREAWADVVRERGEKLGALGARLAGAKPKIEEAKAKVAALGQSLVEAKPSVPAEPAVRVKPAARVALTLPGVAGEVQDYFLRTAMQPSEIMSIVVGLAVPTVLVSGNVIGPSGARGCALHQYLALIAPTGSGKQAVADTSKQCVDQAAAKALLGPNRFKSGAGLVRWVKGHLVSLCVQDEFGSFLSKLGSPKSNPCEVEINDRMREFWGLGPGSIYNSPVGASKDDDSETLQGARLSILGIGTREEFYEACRDSDIANGFLNRIAVLEEPQVPDTRTDYEIGDFPFTLSNQLNKLYVLKPQRLGWGPGAKEIWEGELARLKAETDERKRKLWWRTPEKINRAGGVFAACRFSTTVERSDMEIAQRIMHQSNQVFMRGIEEADKKRALDHAGLKREIARRLADDFPGEASLFEIKRSFRHNTKHKAAIDDALKDMESSGMVKRLRVETGGAPKWVYRLLEQ